MELRSAFAATIRELIKFRSAMGFSPTSYECRFRRFDEYCLSAHPGKSELTRDIVFGWLAREQERNRPGSVRGDATAMRTLANYIRAFGGNAYVLPYRIHPVRRRFVPHVISDSELASLFRRIDELAPKHAGNVSVRGAYSVLFRLVYTCGLRPQEVCAIKIRDIDLDGRTVFLRETKHHSERIIGLSRDMASLLRVYMRRQSEAVPDGIPSVRQELQRKHLPLVQDGPRPVRVVRGVPQGRRPCGTLFCGLLGGNDDGLPRPSRHRPELHREDAQPLFYTVRNGSRKKMTEDNVRKLFSHYGKLTDTSETNTSLHPHLLRHSRAMHLYENGMSLELLSQWLGHAQLETTLIYAHADAEMKRKAIEAATPADSPLGMHVRPTAMKLNDNDLIRRLYGLS